MLITADVLAALAHCGKGTKMVKCETCGAEYANKMNPLQDRHPPSDSPEWFFSNGHWWHRLCASVVLYGLDNEPYITHRTVGGQGIPRPLTADESDSGTPR